MTKDLHLYEFTLSFPKDPFLSKKSPALIGLLVRVQIVHRQRFSLISLTYQILFCCAVKHAEIIFEKKIGLQIQNLFGTARRIAK